MLSAAEFAKAQSETLIVSDKYAPWRILNKAYEVRDDYTINRYAIAKSGASKLYAQALQYLIDGDIDRLQKKGHSCMTYDVKTNDDATEIFGCLFAVATGSKLYLNVKEYTSWMIYLKKFYSNHKRAINLATKSYDPAGVESIKLPDRSRLKKWPVEKISVKPRWTYIPTRDGEVYGQINGVRIKFNVDTGTNSGIYLSDADVRKLGIRKSLIPLGASLYAEDNTGGEGVSLFYAKHFSLGPIHVKNVYIAVGPGNSSYVGLRLLRELGRFSIYSDKIIRGKEHVAACGLMRRVRMPVTQAFSYPFFIIDIDHNRFGLFLDSGMHIRVRGGSSDIYVPVKSASVLQHGHSVKLYDAGKITMTQHGKMVKFPSEQFHIKFGILSLSVSTVPDAMFMITDPDVGGALTYGFLKKGFVYYDFVDRTMCIGRSRR